MARPRNPFPKASLIKVADAYRIVWRHNGKKFEAATRIPVTDKTDAQRLLAAVNAILAAGGADFPPPVDASPAANAYWRALQPHEDDDDDGLSIDSDTRILRAYSRNLASLDDRWARQSLTRIKALGEYAGGLIKVTPQVANEWLDGLKKDGRKKKKKDKEDDKTEPQPVSRATRNRCAAMGSRWGHWMLRMKRLKENPFEGIGILREEHPPEDIRYCTREERYRIMEAAAGLGPSEELAVALAFYSGMRRSEIFRAEWIDIDFSRRRIIVRKSKTGKRRVSPFAQPLLPILEKHKKSSGVISVPPEGKSWETFEADTIDTIRSLLPRLDEKLIAWGTWRHTFGSLLAQKNVGLDKISAWMGNTSEVCRRHYAQFLPRDSRDEDIDRLV